MQPRPLPFFPCPPSTCLAARPLVLYLGADGVYRFSMTFLTPSSCAVGLPAVACFLSVLRVGRSRFRRIYGHPSGEGARGGARWGHARSG
eukprot:scaffold64146_cov35-Tisochrysis_lutea.AAC.1